jgi:WD40 repeat protein
VYEFPATPGQKVLTGTLGHLNAEARRIRLADGGSAVATLLSDGTVRLWREGTGEAIGEPLAVVGVYYPDELAVVSDRFGRQLLACTAAWEDGRFTCLWDPSTRELVDRSSVGALTEEPIDETPIDLPLRFPSREDEPAAINALERLPGTGTVVSAHYAEPVLRLRDLRTGQQTGAIEVPSQGISTLAVLPGPAGSPVVAAAGYSDPSIWLLDPATGAPVGNPLVGHDEGVTKLVAVLDADGAPLLASASWDGTLRLWDLEGTYRPESRVLLGHTSGVDALAIAPRTPRPMLVSGGMDARVRRWDVITGKEVGSALEFGSRVLTVTAGVGPAGAPVVVAGGERDGGLLVWDVVNGHRIGVMEPDLSAATTALVTLPDDQGDVVAQSGIDGLIRRWDLASLNPAGPPLSGHTPWWFDAGNPVTLLPWRTANGTALLSGGCDGTIRLWPPTPGW